jgi:hypothetical protein
VACLRRLVRRGRHPRRPRSVSRSGRQLSVCVCCNPVWGKSCFGAGLSCIIAHTLRRACVTERATAKLYSLQKRWRACFRRNIYKSVVCVSLLHLGISDAAHARKKIRIRINLHAAPGMRDARALLNAWSQCLAS